MTSYRTVWLCLYDILEYARTTATAPTSGGQQGGEGTGYWGAREWGHLWGDGNSLSNGGGLPDHTHSLKSTDAHTQEVDFTKCKLQLKPD